MEEEINLLDYIKVLKKRWKIIFLIFFFACLSAVIVSLRMPKIYQASTSVFVIESKPSFTGLNLPIPVDLGGFVGGGSPYLISLLNSNSLKGKIINRLKLDKNEKFIGKIEVKDKDFIMWNTLKNLNGCTKITDDKKGLIIVSVETKDPKLCSDIANSYIYFLDKSIFTVARKNREFLESQIKKNKKNLQKAEENLRRFQEKHKTFALDKEASEKISAYANLQSQEISNQISLEQTSALLKHTGSIPNLVELEIKKVALQTENAGLKRTLSQMEREFLKLPATSKELARLLREVKIQGMLFETLIQQYELAKITEQKEDVKFQVIDYAYPPVKHIKPKKRLNVMIAGVLSLFFGTFLAFFMEYIEGIKKDEAVKDG